MADSSLDDFFAKKDKSKKSKKKSNISTDEIAKKLEESKRTEKLRKNSKEKNIIQSINVNVLEQEDEEWNDFEEEREKDYSGLRIQTLTIKDKEEELREQQMQENEEESKREGQSGPWKKSTARTDSTPNDSEDESSIPKSVPKEPVVSQPAQQGGKYVPPHLRNQPQSGTTGTTELKPTSLLSTRRGKVGAPKIGDIVEFPSLGGPVDNDIKGYQTVKHGSNRDMADSRASEVALDNKYGLLTNRSKEEIQNSD